MQVSSANYRKVYSYRKGEMLLYPPPLVQAAEFLEVYKDVLPSPELHVSSVCACVCIVG